MKILPNYSKQPICHFCKKNLADSKCGTSSDFYCVSESGLMSYKYITTTVEVPRCKECERKHTLASLPGAIVALILYALMIIKIIVPTWMEGHSLGGNILYTILMLFITTIPAGLALMVSQYIFSFVVKTNSELYIDDYEPIRKLRGMGFRRTKPKAHNHPQALFTEKRFRDCLKSIIEKDKCITKPKFPMK